MSNATMYGATLAGLDPNSFITDPTTFSEALIAAFNGPSVQPMIDALNAWQASEGQWGATGEYNAVNMHDPLNTRTDYIGNGTSLPPDNATLSFPDWASGLANTVAFINTNDPGIANSLATGNQSEFLSSVEGWNPGSPGYAAGIAALLGQGVPVTGGQGGQSASGGGTATTTASSTPSWSFGDGTIPPTPDSTSDPLTEMGRLVAWGSEMFGWSVLSLMVLIIGGTLIAVALILFMAVLFAPVARTAASVVLPGKLLGKITGLSKGATGATGSLGAAAASSAATSAPTVDNYDEGYGAGMTAGLASMSTARNRNEGRREAKDARPQGRTIAGGNRTARGSTRYGTRRDEAA